MRGTYLEHLTWPEAEQLLAKGATVVLPVGARASEHGAHLPLNAEWIVAEYLARRVAQQCEVVVLPTIGYPPSSTEHRSQVALRPQVFRDLVLDICRSLVPHGAQRFYVLNTVDSIIVPLREAAAILSRERVRFAFTDVNENFASIRKHLPPETADDRRHELETSMLLYIAPETVRLEHARRDIGAAPKPGRLTRDPNRGSGTYSATGSDSDPTLATRETGQFVVEAMVSSLVRIISEFY